MATMLDSGRRLIKVNANYEGEIKYNVPQGYGKVAYPNTFFTYEGDWVEGIKQGQGTLSMKDGSYYRGEFKDGEIDGVGIRYWSSSGNVYEGEFEKGELCGKGFMKYGNGDTYCGSWLDNKRHGEGVLTKPNGEMYEGSFYLHQRHGEGKQTYSDGGSYEGGWIKGARHGQGVMTFSDGSVYDGQWRYDEMHGEGALTHASQISYQGIWNNGRPLDEPTCLVVGGEEAITLEYNEMSFTLGVECRTADNEVTTECGRTLRVSAGVHVAEGTSLTPSKTSCISIKSDVTGQEEGSCGDLEKVDTKSTRSTPFGFEVESYPLYTKKVFSDFVDGSTEENLVTVDQVKDDTNETPASPPTPLNKFRDIIKKVEVGLDYEYLPVLDQKTSNGKVTFIDLVLPVAELSFPSNGNEGNAESPDSLEVKNASRRKDAPEGMGSGKKRKKIKVKQPQDEKNEEISSSDAGYKPGDYIIIIEDVTESPFLDILLEPIYLIVKVPIPVKKSKNSQRNK